MSGAFSYEDWNAMRQRAFMDANHHLMSPWLYGPLELLQRETLLLKLNWQRESQKLGLLKLEEIPK